ncbi:MAG: hypothetical protein EOP04_19785 [Proteobacteria bacterium]|nr:MAG: hypothetical protein EOP04_19785 [Pseudomonadota bacterium]
MLNQGFRWIVLLCFMASQAYSQSQSVQEYARECAKAVGGGVPAFSCKQGALIPIKNYANDSTCDNPAFLSGVSNGCIQRSRFGKLTPTDLQPGTSADDIEIRFLCRHYLLPSNPSDYDERFDDIAVIQTNKKTGATCFYQSSTGASQDMAGTNIPAPADASARTITNVGPQGCIGCHNARPFINTPFLQSVPEPHKIPHPNQFNRNQYWFPGESGRNAKIFNITTADTTCTTCHNIASSEENSPGGSSGKLADESIGTSLNPNTGTFDHAYMKIYAPNNFNSVMSSYKECISAGSGNRPANCKVVDISSAARNAYDAGSTWIPPVLSSTPVVDGKVYSLVGGFSNKCLDVIGASTNNGAKLQQWDCNGSSGQKFRFKRVRDDLWAFASLSSNRCVSSESGKLDNRNPMLLWDCNYTPDQLVRFRSLGNGGYKIVWASSDKCMDVQDTSADNGKAVFQYECTDVPDQNWYLKKN